jgi:hypothetical protein
VTPLAEIPDVGRRYFDAGRTQSYELARRGVIPTIELGERRRKVPVAELHRRLGLPVGVAANARGVSSPPAT